MEKILREFIDRGWLEPCHSKWASPCFVVPKKVAGEWRLVVDYRSCHLALREAGPEGVSTCSLCHDCRL